MDKKKIRLISEEEGKLISMEKKKREGKGLQSRNPNLNPLE